MALTTLFLDLNAYFASVEQQVQPALRGKPVAVAPITADSGCCIAVSYEAKAFGVKTGTRVGEARRLCPRIRIVDARPRLYVLMHHRILEAVDRHIPVDKVHSIDELSCRLDRTQRTPEAAAALAARLKAELRSHCGVCMRASIGVAPNRVLAKLGTDLKKPDGLVIFRDEDLPGAIASLSPQELAGIGPRMMKRLRAAGVGTVEDLLSRSEREMRSLWGSLLGECWYHWLRGREVREKKTRRSSIGHQHVLAPDVRTPEGARAVSIRLLLKAAARMRFDGFAARRLTLGLGFPGDAPNDVWGGASWDASATLGEGATDSLTILAALEDLWRGAPLRPPVLVGVTLHDLVHPASRTLPLFTEERRRENLSRAMDAVNKKFGANKVYTAAMQDARSHGTGGIAFSVVPRLEITDSVQSRQRGGGGSAPLLTDAQMVAMIEASLAEGVRAGARGRPAP